ncbi:MAG: hypothetical protein IJW44_00540 [Clostridia bacterium]|nr:hypothetical protein [Clostridia bacterium]
MSQIKEMKILARTYLGQKGNWARMIFAGGLLIFVCFLPLLLAGNLTAILLGDTAEAEQLLWLENLLVYGIGALLFLLITVPGVALFYRYSWRLYTQSRDGINVPATQAKRKPAGVWFDGFRIVLRPLLVAALFALAYYFGSLSGFLLYLPLVALAIGLSVLLMWATGGWFLFPYFLCRGEKKAIRQSRRAMKKHYKRYGAYMLSFLGLVLLSLLTAGVLLMFYVLPLMMFTYFALGDRLSAEQTQEEKDQ